MIMPANKKPAHKRLKTMLPALRNKIRSELEMLGLSRWLITKTTQAIIDNIRPSVNLELDNAEFNINERVRDLVDRFKNEGLTLPQYLEAATKDAKLFTYPPEDLETNIRDMAKRFEAEGLTVEEYLKTALKEPMLFTRSTKILERNIRDLVEIFQDQGLTVSDYLKKGALKLPSLFTQNPATIANHIVTIITMYRSKTPEVNGESSGNSLKPLFDSLLKHPIILTLSDDNLCMHGIYASVTDNHRLGILRKSRSSIEKRLDVLQLRNDDPKIQRDLAKFFKLEDGVDTKSDLFVRGVILQELVKKELLPGVLSENNPALTR